MPTWWETATQYAAASKIKLTNDLLWVDLSRQRLEHWQNGHRQQVYTISTSARPPNNTIDSLGTPTGWFEVAARHGEEAPAGTVFRGRVSCGYHWKEAPAVDQKKNLVTSRILRLQGLEEGHNRGGDCDTWERYIYFHGTNHPDKLGTPQSAGCILLSDSDIIQLFPIIPTGTVVWIPRETIKKPNA